MESTVTATQMKEPNWEEPKNTLVFQIGVCLVFPHEPFTCSLHGDKIKSV